MNYLKWELKVFFINQKNIILFALLLIASLYYCFYIAPTYQPNEAVNKGEIEARYEERKEFLETVDIENSTHYYTLFAIQIFPEWNEYDKERLDALEKGDLHAYARATQEWYLYAVEMIRTDPFDVLRFNPRYYTYGNRFAKEDGHYNYLYTAERYGHYAIADYKLDVNVLEERTALQTLKRMLESGLPYILLLTCLLLSNDIVMKDRKHPSMVNGFPMTPFKRIILKGIVALIGSLVSIILLIPAFLIIGLRNGFGSLDLPAVTYNFAFFNNETFESMSMGMYLLKYLAIVLLWFMLIIGLVLLMSILLKNEYFNLIIGVVCFVEIIYHQRGWVPKEWLSYLPTSYVQIGDVLTGYKNYTLYTDALTPEKGFLVLLLTVIIVLLFIKVVINKKKMTI
ncbi:ABC transporter permease [Ornithinibacillus halotolerans]|uniref:ABC transporter permease n=1 Tax=Ornithinibacillus halotolerans TaxID=1274357 RepID=A0A916S008_9BACI|nr:ABC transporter permease [Ornithinibacillus halotolerans]GGA78688.1 ABC transporter permease [Ornithinibacillus halotolerans]